MATVYRFSPPIGVGLRWRDLGTESAPDLMRL
jgi:hypothetical protein